MTRMTRIVLIEATYGFGETISAIRGQFSRLTMPVAAGNRMLVHTPDA